MLLKIFVVVFFSLLYFHCAFSAEKLCGQHQFKITKLKTCGGKGDSLILHDISVTLTDDCHVVPRGCYTIKKKLPDIKVNYFVSKPPLFNKNGTEDLCEAMTDAKFQKMVAPYKSLDTKCPIEAKKYCITKGSSLVDKLNPAVLNMAVGTVKARADFVSEKGKAKACIEMEAVISKK